MFNKVWTILKDEVYHMFMTHYCFILLLLDVGIVHSLLKENVFSHIPFINILLEDFSKYGTSSLSQKESVAA